VDHETGTELRLEPSGLRRHDVASVGDVYELVHGHGIEGESHLHLTAVHATLKLSEAAYATDEVYALVRTEVGDSEYVAEDKVGAYGYVEHADRILVVVCACLCSERIPAAVEIEREVVEGSGSVDFSAHVLHVEVLTHLVEELLRSEAVEVAHHAVVVDDLEVRSRESHSHEIVVFLVAAMVGVVLGLFCAYESGSRTAVVSVSDVKVRNLGKLLGDRLDGLRILDEPKRVAEIVVGNEVVFGLSGSNVADDLFKHLIVGESEEHRLHVGVVDADMLHAVFLLVAAAF